MTPPREVIPGLPHHVVHRGNNRRRLFSYPVERWAFLRLVTEAARATGCAVHAWCLLDNHVHMIVTPPEPKSLSRFVHRWAQQYARRRNHHREGSGKLFEQTFFSRPLRTDAELAIATAYVDLNSLRAGTVDSPEDDPWSTAALHLGAPYHRFTPVHLWAPTAWYRSLSDTTAERARQYREWLEASEVRRAEYARALGCLATERAALSYAHRLRRPDETRACEP